VGAGGRYDGLVKSLGGPDVPAVGFALGMDRVARALDALRISTARPPRVFVAVAGAVTEEAWSLVERLRAEGGWSVELGAPGKSLKAQLRAADGWGATAAVIVGEDEWKRDRVVLRNLTNSQQEEIPVGDLSNALRAQNRS
jgi:histidyl-tRNA synthetase